MRLERVASCFLGLLLVAVVPVAADDSFADGGWPFKPLVSAAVPSVGSVATCSTAVDSFVVQRLEEKGLNLNGQADKLTLLRRIHFDLIGLPPTAEDHDAFLADGRPDATERLIDRLLSSPRYGERWARHWLDLVRYAETAGFKVDEARPDAFKYRDYVIRAWNNDTPYHRFIAEQLAGDELDPQNPDVVVATGLNRLYPEESTASNFRQARQAVLDDVTEVTGLVFMGLTLGCAKCHDHKFDPIEQKDYFRLQACFASMLPRNDLVTAPAAERQEFSKRNTEWEAATQSIRSEMDSMTKPLWPQAFEEIAQTLDPDSAAAIRTPMEKRTSLQMALVALVDRTLTRKVTRLPRRLEGEAKKRFEELQKQLTGFDNLKPAPLPMAMVVSNMPMEPPPTFVLATGDYRKPLTEVPPGFPVFLGASELLPESSPQPSGSTGRRLALANWLGRRDHPLTARVMVNRVWQHLFGTGLVSSPNDFGSMGTSATHRELLDWLAAEFVDRDWSIKSMQRLLTTSAAYQQSSTIYPTLAHHKKGQEMDVDNGLLWHASRRRLEGEAIRDAMLYVSGELNLRMHGASAKPKLPDAVIKNGRFSWEPDPLRHDQNRRSIYVIVKRNLRLPILGAFDPPDVYNSTPVRGVTVTATQTLTVLNNEQTLDPARRWAGKLLSQSYRHNLAAVATQAYVQAFGRRPDSEELEATEDFFTRHSAMATPGSLSVELLPEPQPVDVPPQVASAWVDFCHALMNSSEFLFVD